MSGFVYILASRKNGTLYTGITTNLSARVWQHKKGADSKFTAKYSVNRLVWYEKFLDITDAIAREKQLKKWRRVWKINLIEKMNPDWDDLYLRFNH